MKTRESCDYIDGTDPAHPGSEETIDVQADSRSHGLQKASDAALAHARRIAASSGATIHLLHVVDNAFLAAVADAALSCAKRLAAQMRGSVCLLHVIDHPTAAGTFGSELCPPQSPHLAQQRAEIARVELGSRMLADSGSGIAITGDIAFGAGAATISSYAANHGFDLIVMGKHRRSGLAPLLIGSVAETVIRIAGCPVLIVTSQHQAYARTSNAEAAYAAV